MGYLQTLVNGIVLGTLYACLAVGFSLVWGVLNVINMLHGSLIVSGRLPHVLRLAQLRHSPVYRAAGGRAAALPRSAT